jgi:hypothetical protein
MSGQDFYVWFKIFCTHFRIYRYVCKIWNFVAGSNTLTLQFFYLAFDQGFIGKHVIKALLVSLETLCGTIIGVIVSSCIKEDRYLNTYNLFILFRFIDINQSSAFFYYQPTGFK